MPDLSPDDLWARVRKLNSRKQAFVVSDGRKNLNIYVVKVRQYQIQKVIFTGRFLDQLHESVIISEISRGEDLDRILN